MVIFFAVICGLCLAEVLGNTFPILSVPLDLLSLLFRSKLTSYFLQNAKSTILLKITQFILSFCCTIMSQNIDHHSSVTKWMQKWTDPLCGLIVLDSFRSWYSPKLQTNQKLSGCRKHCIVQHTGWAVFHPLCIYPWIMHSSEHGKNHFRVFVCTHCGGIIGSSCQKFTEY